MPKAPILGWCFLLPSQARGWNRMVGEGIPENVLFKLIPIKREGANVKNAETRRGGESGV